ncbi:MAG TPA: TerC family protein [Rhodopila sp.]|nr:TerC family protein [Rhodopila sp.]
MHWLTDPQAWTGLLTLTVMEIVLGIDNLVFIAVLVARVRPAHQAWTRRMGLGLALLTRIALLAGITWIAAMSAPVFTVAGHSFSWRDLVLTLGGLFLVYKGTREIHARIEGDPHAAAPASSQSGLIGVVLQIALLDIVFSLDSVITAVGMVSELPIMITAVVIAIGVMLLAAGPTVTFIERHPTVKMLVFSFLLLIGMTLMADGFGMHVPRGYIYAAIGFSIAVEILNQLAGRRRRATAQVAPAPRARHG